MRNNCVFTKFLRVFTRYSDGLVRLGGNKQLIAVITNISGGNQSIKDKKPSTNTMEIVCSDDQDIQKFKDIIDNYFQVQSVRIQTSFSGYIRHKSLSQ